MLFFRANINDDNFCSHAYVKDDYIFNRTWMIMIFSAVWKVTVMKSDDTEVADLDSHMEINENDDFGHLPGSPASWPRISCPP